MAKDTEGILQGGDRWQHLKLQVKSAEAWQWKKLMSLDFFHLLNDKWMHSEFASVMLYLGVLASILLL
jgi:hypothetical protein